MKNFTMMGAAGFIAPRHMRAIRDIKGDLKIAFDPNDSVGVIDSFFPQSEFYSTFDEYDLALQRNIRSSTPVDFLSICSPNHLHEPHVHYGVRSGIDVICEKPLTLSPQAIDGFLAAESYYKKSIYTILQLRLHPSVIELKSKMASSTRRASVDLTYITSRGSWYHNSWKGDERKSGGIATNIGVHFFDMLAYVFGPLEKQFAHLRHPSKAAGFLEYKNADVRWFLSIDSSDLPEELRGRQSTYRSLKFDGDEFEFSDGFTDLHTKSYDRILSGEGFGLQDARPAIETVYAFRQLPIVDRGELHPKVVSR